MALRLRVAHSEASDFCAATQFRLRDIQADGEKCTKSQFGHEHCFWDVHTDGELKTGAFGTQAARALKRTQQHSDTHTHTHTHTHTRTHTHKHTQIHMETKFVTLFKVTTKFMGTRTGDRKKCKAWA